MIPNSISKNKTDSNPIPNFNWLISIPRKIPNDSNPIQRTALTTRVTLIEGFSWPNSESRQRSEILEIRQNFVWWKLQSRVEKQCCSRRYWFFMTFSDYFWNGSERMRAKKTKATTFWYSLSAFTVLFLLCDQLICSYWLVAVDLVGSWAFFMN